MPTTQTNSNAVNARRFAALLAGFDIGNASEEEAVSKARALRRMAADAHVRIVDLLELPDVRRAIDDQMQPVRKPGAGVQQAIEEADRLREELTERTRDVRRLVEMLKEREEKTGRSSGQAHFSPAAPTLGSQCWPFEIGVLALAITLLAGSFYNSHFVERRNGNEHRNGKGSSTALVRKGSTVLPVPKPGAVHRRVFRNRTPNESR